MARIHVVVISVALAAGHFVRAENGPFSVAWNMARSGGWCGLVSRADLTAAGVRCEGPQNQRLSAFRLSAAEILDRAIYEDAADRQLRKNACFGEQADLLASDANAFQMWSEISVAAWLGLKKAQLARARCNEAYWQSSDPAHVGRFGREEAFERSERGRSLARRMGPMHPSEIEWRKLCLNDRWAVGLQNAEANFLLMPPVYSSPEIFGAIERLRAHLIIQSADGPRPISDEDILALDLNDLQSVSFDGSAIPDRMRAALAAANASRSAISRRLKDSRGRDGQLQLDAGLRRYVYQDGTLDESLERHGLLTRDPMGRRKSVSTGAACVLAWQESSMIGSIGDFVATTMVLRKGIFESIAGISRAARAGGAAYEAAAAARSRPTALAIARADKWSGRLAPLLAQSLDVAETAANSCLSGVGRTQRTSRAGNNDAILRTARWTLPEGLAFDPTVLDFDASQVPSCDDSGQKLSVDLRGSAHCMRDVLFSMAPPWALPPLLTSFR